VATQDGVVMVDAPSTLGDKLQAAIGSVTDRPVLTLGSEEIQLLYPAPTTRSATSWSTSLRSAWVPKSG
jgi:hypothetical protein